jgi:hypothetical protein
MKTLDQIESRIPISTAPFIITAAGSYYLTTNLTVNTGDAIIIETNGVTLDLKGFTISSTAPSPTGSGIDLLSAVGNKFVPGGGLHGQTRRDTSGLAPTAFAIVRRISVALMAFGQLWRRIPALTSLERTGGG